MATTGIGLATPRPSPVARPQPVAPRAPQTEGQQLGVPQFADSPLGAIGFLLSQTAAGLQGRETPLDRLRAERMERQTLKIRQVEVGAKALEHGLSLLSRASVEERPQLVGKLSELYGEVMPGFGDVLTSFSDDIPTAMEFASTVGEFAPHFIAECGDDIECMRALKADTARMDRLQTQRDQQNFESVGMKLHHIMGVKRQNPSAHQGSLTMQDVFSLNDQSLAGTKYEITESEKATIRRHPEILLEHGIKTPDMIEFEAKERFKSDLRLAEGRVDAGKSDLLDARGNVKDEVSNNIFKRTATLLGAQVDPRTGLMTNLTPEMARNAQDRTLVASALLQTGRASNMDDAIAMANQMEPGEVQIGRPLPEADRAALPISPEKREELVDQQAEIARILPMLGGKVEAASGVGLWSNVQSGMNSLAQVFATTAFDDNEANRQTLRELNNDVKRALANNPRFSEGEQKRIQALLPDPNDWFSNPITAKKNMLSLQSFLLEREEANEKLLSGKKTGAGGEAGLPPSNKSERVVGQVYRNQQGHKARWTGDGWEGVE